MTDIECTYCKRDLEGCMASACPYGAEARASQRAHEAMLREEERKRAYLVRLEGRVAELESAVHRALAAGETEGVLEAEAFAILQGVVHDGIPAPTTSPSITKTVGEP